MSIRHRLLGLAQKALRPIDIEVSRWSSTSDVLLARMIASCGVNRLLDVGAHRGGYVSALRRAGWSGPTDSFEPDPRSFVHLNSLAAKNPGWRAHQLALGNHTGTAVLHQSVNETSSSLAEVLDLHIREAPESRVTGNSEVPLGRLDDVVSLSAHDTVMLKIDAQGFEAQVLEGASGIMNQICMIQVEMSLRPLYDSQPLWQRTVDSIDQLGFRLGRVIPGFYSPTSGEMFQMDGIFLRR